MKKTWTGLGNLLIILIVSSLGWVTPAWAQTFPITIDPQAFLGGYVPYVSNPYSFVTGVQTYNLAPGTYNLDIGLAGSCHRKAFTVNGDGTVSNPVTNDSSGALDFVGSTVRFKNNTVNFDGGAYPGTIWIQLGLTGPFSFTPPGSLVVVPDNVYRIRITGFSNVHFRVNASGQVEPIPINLPGCSGSVPSNDALIFSGNTVQLKNTTVRIDPRQYTGNYYLFGLVKKGIQDLVLVPGFDFIVKLTSLDSFGQLYFKTNADGTVGLFTPPQGEFVLPDNPCPFKQMQSRLDFLVAPEL
jgi:hypothetical protein